MDFYSVASRFDSPSPWRITVSPLAKYRDTQFVLLSAAMSVRIHTSLPTFFEILGIMQHREAARFGYVSDVLQDIDRATPYYTMRQRRREFRAGPRRVHGSIVLVVLPVPSTRFLHHPIQQTEMRAAVPRSDRGSCGRC